MTRTKLIKLIGKKITAIRYADDYSAIVFLDEEGKIMFQVPGDHLFDANGMHFDTNEI